MTNMQDRVDVSAEINACERIRALDETRLDLELSKTGLDPDGLARRLEAMLGIEVRPLDGSDGAIRPAVTGHASPGLPPQLPVVVPSPPTPTASPNAIAAAAPALGTLELAGTIKFFNATRGFGFFVADGDQGDVMVHVSCLRLAGYQTVYEGARIHAFVQRTLRGLQATHIVSIDQSSAVHPSQLPQRTRAKVQAESDWVRAIVKWYSREAGYGFVYESEDSPECFVHADVLRRWGIAPLSPKQVVEIRWGMSSKGRMVAEIRYPDGRGLTPLPPVH